MDLVGHCAVAEMSGVLKEEEVYGPGIVEVMFPNYAHCHDWAYGHVWEPERFGKLARTGERLRAHIICDWVIHYGTDHTHIKEKVGWAFKRMDIAGKHVTEFFATAAHKGMLRTELPDLATWTEKKRLDFAHSMVEYAVDLILTERTITPKRYQAIKDGLAPLATNDGYGSCPWALNMFRELGVTSERDPDFILWSIHQMARDAVESESPKEFAIRTAAHKYGFEINPETISYVRSYLERIAGELDLEEVTALCDQIAAVIKQPESIYSGPWRHPSINFAPQVN
jgi:hypothetical protein